MRVTYDPEADAMRIRFNDKRKRGGSTMDDQVIIHTAEDGTLVEIELLDVSHFADDVPALIERYGKVRQE